MRSTATRALLLLPVLLLACRVATIRPIESRENGGEGRDFDAANYVESLWTEDVPVALERAVDLRELLPALAADPPAAGERWGRREGSGPFHVIVEGTGRVVGVDTSSRTGLARVEVETPAGAGEVVLQVGPVLRGTSIRDALPGVSFDQFLNQIQYAEVANALNARIESGLLASLDREGLEGKRIRFVGMATLGEGPLIVTPVQIDAEGER